MYNKNASFANEVNSSYMRWISGGLFVENHLTQGTLSH